MPDYHICRMLIQFEAYGALIHFEIYILESLGYLDQEYKHFIPYTEDISIFTLNRAGKRAVKNALKKWRAEYAQTFEIEAKDIVDAYLEDNAGDYFWGFSLSRVLKEKSLGNLSEVIERGI